MPLMDEQAFRLFLNRNGLYISKLLKTGLTHKDIKKLYISHIKQFKGTENKEIKQITDVYFDGSYMCKAKIKENNVLKEVTMPIIDLRGNMLACMKDLQYTIKGKLRLIEEVVRNFTQTNKLSGGSKEKEDKLKEENQNNINSEEVNSSKNDMEKHKKIDDKGNHSSEQDAETEEQNKKIKVNDDSENILSENCKTATFKEIHRKNNRRIMVRNKCEINCEKSRNAKSKEEKDPVLEQNNAKEPILNDEQKCEVEIEKFNDINLLSNGQICINDSKISSKITSENDDRSDILNTNTSNEKLIKNTDEINNAENMLRSVEQKSETEGQNNFISLLKSDAGDQASKNNSISNSGEQKQTIKTEQHLNNVEVKVNSLNTNTNMPNEQKINLNKPLVIKFTVDKSLHKESLVLVNDNKESQTKHTDDNSTLCEKNEEMYKENAGDNISKAKNISNEHLKAFKNIKVQELPFLEQSIPEQPFNVSQDKTAAIEENRKEEWLDFSGSIEDE